MSVLMASRNHAEFVADAVRSVLEQDYEALELIAVDDASDDETADILEQCAADAPEGRMRVARHDRQVGIAATRAHALRLARGEYIALLDSDDLWLPGKVSPQIELLKSEPTVGVAHAAFEAFDSATGRLVPWQPTWDDTRDPLAELVRRGCFVMTGTSVIRRAAIDRRGVGFVTLEYPSYDDYLLFMTIALDWEFAYESRTVMRYRRHLGNLTNVLFAENVALARLRLLRQFFDRFPESRGRLAGETRPTFARLCVQAAAHELTSEPYHALRLAVEGLLQHPPAALEEVARGVRNRALARRSSR